MTNSATPSPVRFADLLRDASGCPSDETNRQVYRTVADTLGRHGAPIGWKAVEKWADRQSMPGAWLVRLIAAAAKEGRPLDVASYA